jgi:hypothetical protein
VVAEAVLDMEVLRAHQLLVAQVVVVGQLTAQVIQIVVVLRVFLAREMLAEMALLPHLLLFTDRVVVVVAQEQLELTACIVEQDKEVQELHLLLLEL